MEPPIHPHLEHKPHHHLKWGIFFTLLAWLFFTLAATMSRFASRTAPISSIVFFQNFISWIVILPWVFHHGVQPLKTKRFGLIFLRSVAGLCGFLFLFLAVKRISLVNSLLLNNTAPIFVPFVVWLWLKIPVNHKLWPGIVGGFIGIVFILKPGANILSPGALYALGAGVWLSLTMVSVRLLSYTERTHAVLFYYFLIASLLSLPFALYNWVAPSWSASMEILGVAIFFILGQWAFIRAFHHAKPSQLGPFCYSSILYSALIEWALWGNIPDLWTWIGIALVCLGGIWAIRFSAAPAPPLHQ